MMKVLSLGILAVTLLSLCLAALCVQAAQGTYPYSGAFIIVLVVASTVGGVAVLRGKLLLYLLQNALTVLAFAKFILAVSNWPGGDDGPGMILIAGVGPLLLAATVISIGSAIVLLVSLIFRKQADETADRRG